MKPVLEVITSGAGYLHKRGIDEARLNMEHLLAHVLQCRRMDLYLRFDAPVQEQDLELLRPLLKRRGEGEPLQHLLGTVEFYGHEFICDHRALIPRPETEVLVDLLVKRYGTNPPATVLDVCTGSGCIGLALAKVWPASKVTLSDVSEEALELTRLNAERLSVAEQVRVVRSDLLEKITGTFDLITANPPYIASGEIKSLSREVQRDPKLALDGGPTGVELPLRLVTEALPHLTPASVLALELGHDQAEAVITHLQAAGFTETSAHCDLAGVPRFVIASGYPLPPPVVDPTDDGA
jgi:release factor glutamine methyltransferase